MNPDCAVKIEVHYLSFVRLNEKQLNARLEEELAGAVSSLMLGIAAIERVLPHFLWSTAAALSGFPSPWTRRFLLAYRLKLQPDSV